MRGKALRQRRERHAELARQDQKHRCWHCKRALPAREAYVIACDPQNRRFCSDECLDASLFLEGMRR
jgi:hypothetical protein